MIFMNETSVPIEVRVLKKTKKGCWVRESRKVVVIEPDTQADVMPMDRRRSLDHASSQVTVVPAGTPTDRIRFPLPPLGSTIRIGARNGHATAVEFRQLERSRTEPIPFD